MIVMNQKTKKSIFLDLNLRKVIGIGQKAVEKNPKLGLFWRKLDQDHKERSTI